VACVWLFLVAADVARVRELDLGLTPYLAAAGLLVFTVLSFFAFVRTFSAEETVAHASTLGWLYWTLFAASAAVMAATYFLTFYFQIILG
jgi:hypothetical protein